MTAFHIAAIGGSICIAAKLGCFDTARIRKNFKKSARRKLCCAERVLERAQRFIEDF